MISRTGFTGSRIKGRVKVAFGTAASLAVGAAGLAASFAAMVSEEVSPSPPTPTEFAPRQYFNQHCSNCHGDDGSNYGPEFGRHLDEVSLNRVVKEMAEGPGQAPLSAKDLKVLVAFHRSLIAGEPFAVWVEKGLVETSKGATLTVKRGKATLRHGSDSLWDVVIDDPATSELVVKSGEKHVTLKLSEQSHTHKKPLSSD